MLLSIPQCTKQPSTTNDYLTPNFNYAEVEKPCSSKRGIYNKWLHCGGIHAKICVSTRYQSKYVCMGGRGHWEKLHGEVTPNHEFLLNGFVIVKE